ncbi:MAG: dockerin type I domain-containing protein [Clostridiales bacterium]|nr:dockerin type I domain-containing protein [Clostridiales bacterium]
MGKNKRLKKTLPFIVVVTLLLTLMPGMPLTAYGQDFVADAGTAPYPVSVNIVASTPNGAYNGVLVHLKVESGIDQLQMYGTGADAAPMRFVRSLSLPTGSSSFNDYNSDKDIWTCGFLYYAARNPIEAATMTVGRLEFTYVGDEPVKITLLDMDLVRIVDFSEDHDILANSEREPVAPPVAEINITRASGPEGFVAVTDISGVPSTATAGVSRTLTSSVVPTDATNKDIIWTVKDAGTTGATIVSGNRLNTTAIGTAVLTATIVNGRGIGVDYIKDFPIAVGSAPFVAVESIAGLPSEAMVGEPLALTGTVMPGDATNKTIEWSILEAGTTGAVITGGNILNATSGGTVIISATVRGGANNGMSDYVRQFMVIVKEPIPPPFVAVTGIIGMVTIAEAGIPLALAGIVEPENATNKDIMWSVVSSGTTGANIANNVLYTENTGTTIVRATIVNGLEKEGTNYTKDFIVTVSALHYGDVDGNGRVAPMDATLLSRYLAGWPGILIKLAAADVDGDGEVTPYDLAILQRHIAGWPGYETLPYQR